MKKILLSLIAILSISLVSFSQEVKETFKPNGKPVIRIFSNVNSTFSDGDSQTSFDLTRVYLGYEHNFSENFTGTVVYDVGNPGTGKFELTGFVKNAYLGYEKDKLSIDFGMISTTQFKVQEGFWGYRYMEKSFQDAYEFASSADLGTSITYEFCKAFSADFAIYNGEGYKKLQSDKYLKPTLGFSISPAKQLLIRGMFDTMGKDITQQTYAGFLGYKTGNLSLAAEYNYQKNNKMIDGNNFYGTSFYGTYKAAKQIKVFARYDDLKSDTPANKTVNWNLAKDGTLFITGFEYTPVSGIKLTPNYRGWSPADGNKAFTSTLMINCEVKF